MLRGLRSPQESNHWSISVTKHAGYWVEIPSYVKYMLILRHTEYFTRQSCRIKYNSLRIKLKGAGSEKELLICATILGAF